MPTVGSRPRRWRDSASYLGFVAECDLPKSPTPAIVTSIYPASASTIAQQTSTLVGRTARGEQLGLAPTTARSYLNLLTHVYFVHEELIPLSHLHDQAVGTQPIRHATTWKHQKTFLKWITKEARNRVYLRIFRARLAGAIRN